MTKLEKHNRFIPFRKKDIRKMCLAKAHFSSQEKDLFLEFCSLLEGLLHFEFHNELETLKECYAPFNPDADTKTVYSCTKEETNNCQKQLVKSLTDILKGANYQQITKTDIKEALLEESLLKIRLRVNFSDFDEVLFYCRGESVREEQIKYFFGLRQRSVIFTNYERVVMYIKFKDEGYFNKEKKKKILFKPGSTIIKLFQNVPKADIEMLFPNSEVRMKTIDKLLIGIPALGSEIAVIVTKLGASILLLASLFSFWLGLSQKEVVINQTHLVAMGLGLGTLGGFLFRQFNKFKNRKIQFMKTLTDNLYFKSLDNNSGVFHHLIDDAEEEEFKEALLAYFFLVMVNNGLSEKDLDQTIENWLKEKYQSSINFEIKDALRKLEKWRLIQTDGSVIRALDLQQSTEQLRSIWNGLVAGAV